MIDISILEKPLTPPKVLRVISFDTETIMEEKNAFYMGGINDGEYHSFYDKEEMIKALRKYRDRHTYVYANNLEFDLGALFYGKEHFDEVQPIYANNKLISAKVSFKGGHGSVKFSDCMNYGSFSVATQGKILGIPKLEKPVCFGKRPINEVERQELEAYNERDCLVTKQYAEFFQKGINEIGGQLKLTIASTSKDVYTRRFMAYPIKHKTNNDVFSCYYGGRTEAFARGYHEKVNVYDVNSLYPSVMTKELPHPFSLVKGTNLNLYGFSEAIIETNNDNYPFLPYRFNNKLLFPNGKFKGWFTNHELIKAKELNYKVTVLQGYNYLKTDYFFKDYVDNLYKLRLKFKLNKDPMEVIPKLLLNSLYGKFAQKPERDKTIFHLFKGETFTDNSNINENIKWNLDGIGYELIKQSKQTNFMIPILSSYVTSYGRICLYDYIKDSNALYTDTDCVFTHKKLVTSNKLGKMKAVHLNTNGIIVKPKLYLMADEVKSKGFPKMKTNDFLELLNGNPYCYDKLAKIKESIIRGFTVNEPINIIKKADLEDNKRSWQDKFNCSKEEYSTPLLFT